MFNPNVNIFDEALIIMKKKNNLAQRKATSLCISLASLFLIIWICISMINEVKRNGLRHISVITNHTQKKFDSNKIGHLYTSN